MTIATTSKTEFKAPELLAASAVLLGLAAVNAAQCFLEIDWKGLFAGVYAAGLKTKLTLLQLKHDGLDAVVTTKAKALAAATCIKQQADPVRVFDDVKTSVLSFKEEVLLLAKEQVPVVSVLEELDD